MTAATTLPVPPRGGAKSKKSLIILYYQPIAVTLQAFYKTLLLLMIRIEDFIQLKAFARQDGLLLSLLWTASFALIVYMPASAMGNILAIITPLFVAWRLRIFREYALGGIISMRRAYGYSAYTFVYASLVFAIVQYSSVDFTTFLLMSSIK